MLYSTLFVAASAVVGFASAQNNTSFNTVVPCCSVPASTVPQDDRDTWCVASKNTCVAVCGGQSKIASQGNECDPDDLDYTCKCNNGTDATQTLSNFEQSVPGQMCRYWYSACVNATNEDANAQFQCEQAFNATCGMETIEDVGASVSNRPTSSGTARSTGGSDATGTGSGAGSSSTAAAPTMAMLGAPVLGAGMLAVFGLAL